MPRHLYLDEAESSVLGVLDDEVSLDIAQVSCRSLVAPGRASEAIGHLKDYGLVESVERSPVPRYLRRRTPS